MQAGSGIKVVVVGGSGNVGTSVVRALGGASDVQEVVAIARRRPEISLPKTRWLAADVLGDDLRPVFAGADVVIHLAWLIQPSRKPKVTGRVNVDGTARVLEAVRETVPALVYASSVGAYSKGPKDRAVDESWPATGISGSYYSEQKAATERLLDEFEAANPSTRVVRLRPGLIFKEEAGTQIRRFFLGPFAPNPLLRRRLIPAIPNVPGLRFQAVHTDDVADAYVRAALGEARGAFNIAADPVLDPPTLADALGARLIPLPASALRSAAALTWHLRLQPTSPGWVEMALGAPIMDCSRAQAELGWKPRLTSVEALEELLAGIAAGRDYPTPPLAARSSGPLRLNEIRSGVGGRSI
jgi:nucleoside-diphosphate-sugar epimerase